MNNISYNIQKYNMVVKYFLNHYMWGFSENVWIFLRPCGMMFSIFFGSTGYRQGDKNHDEF
jgi:hypothetical protein